MGAPFDSDDLGTLQSTPLFRDLAPRLADRLLAGAVAETHPTGSMLFRQSEPADALLLVLEGWVKLVRESPGGAATVIGVFTRGQSLADAIAVAGSLYPASAQTVTRARIARIDAGNVRAIIRRDPGLALAMFASSAQQQFGLMQQIERLKALKGSERVAQFLLSLAGGTKGSVSIALPFDKILIAAWLGMQPESLSRAFSTLRSIGVQVDGTEVRIADVARLSALSEPAATRRAAH